MCLPANSVCPAGFYRWWCRYRLLLCVCDEVIMWQITQSLHHYISNKFDQSWPLKADAAVGVSKLPVDCFSVPWYLKLMVKNSNYSFIFFRLSKNNLWSRSLAIWCTVVTVNKSSTETNNEFRPIHGFCWCVAACPGPRGSMWQTSCHLPKFI